jgi:hypothetical protein
VKIKIIGSSGGYQNCVYDLDALPHVGEVLNLGNWEGTVAQVVHVPREAPHGRHVRAHRVGASPPGQGRRSRRGTRQAIRGIEDMNRAAV